MYKAFGVTFPYRHELFCGPEDIHPLCYFLLPPPIFSFYISNNPHFTFMSFPHSKYIYNRKYMFLVFVRLVYFF